jgi:hypothetical protein
MFVPRSPNAASGLFVIDAFNPFLSLHGLDPFSTPDIEAFWREIADPIAKAGATPTLLDHVSKNADTRGKYSYGSERKASGAMVHIGFRTLEPFGRGRTGRALLTTHKDRPGYLPRPTVGQLALEQQVEPVSQTWIEKNVQGNATPLRTALEVLIGEGYVVKKETLKGFELDEASPPSHPRHAVHRRASRDRHRRPARRCPHRRSHRHAAHRRRPGLDARSPPRRRLPRARRPCDLRLQPRDPELKARRAA